MIEARVLDRLRKKGDDDKALPELAECVGNEVAFEEDPEGWVRKVIGLA